MKKSGLLIACLFIAALMNISLVAFFIWLSFSPPAFYGKPPDDDFTYLLLAIYPLSNFIVLFFVGERKGITRIFRQLVLIANMVMILIAFIFGISSALEGHFYSGLEIFVTLCLFVPPVVTTLGLYGQTMKRSKAPNHCVDSGPGKRCQI